MYPYLHAILSDQTGGIRFTCFGMWHLLYMAVIFGGIFAVLQCMRKRSETTKQKTIQLTIGLAFGLYILDFFLMPLAYGEIDVEKLPFHMCTAMCVLAFLSRHHRFWRKFQKQFALLGLVSNLIYVVYPAGVGWYQIHPLSYRVVQTLLFHGTMVAYGVFVLAFETKGLHWRDSAQELPVIAAMCVWALVGNALYNGVAGRFFNWFFVVRDPFYLLPETLAPYVMPFVMILVIFMTDLLVYGIYFSVRKCVGMKKTIGK